jgi:hypothetical protein
MRMSVSSGLLIPKVSLGANFVAIKERLAGRMSAIGTKRTCEGQSSSPLPMDRKRIGSLAEHERRVPAAKKEWAGG